MTTETELETLKRARRYAYRKFRQLRENEYRHYHYSFAVRDALLAAEKRFNLPTFGVEGNDLRQDGGEPYLGGDSVPLEYLNTGDAYNLTICYWKGRFILACWGDIVESAS